MTDDLTSRYFHTPVDEGARETLAERGLRTAVVAADDRAGFDRWLDAVVRGFLDEERTEKQRDAAFAFTAGHRRWLGVYDDSGPQPEVPVGTFGSWMTELTVPGGGRIPAAAISSVTVAPTHRRRGIARAMMTGELRRAAAEGAPAAVLTVSESTLYGRYGFAPAAAAASWTIDVKRASWIGPDASGRVDFISRERLRELIPAVHDEFRVTSPGEMSMPAGHWDRFAGTRADAPHPERLRAVQYADADGAVRGLALYSVAENEQDFTASTVKVSYLVAATPDAYAGLWRFFLDMDLIGTLTAGELSVDEPLLWMISDQRAAVVTVTDHQYVRILDVPAALGARRFGAPGTLALEVHDPLEIGGGRFLLRVDADGRGTVDSWTGEVPADAVAVRLGIAELSAAYLGSVSLSTLAAAGRVQSTDAATAARVLGWHEPARLSFWY